MARFLQLEKSSGFRYTKEAETHREGIYLVGARIIKLLFSTPAAKKNMVSIFHHLMRPLNTKTLEGRIARFAMIRVAQSLELDSRMSFKQLGFSPVELRATRAADEWIAQQGYSVRELMAAGVNPVLKYLEYPIPFAGTPSHSRAAKNLFREKATKSYSRVEAFRLLKKEGLSDELIFQLCARDGYYGNALSVLRNSSSPSLSGFNPPYIFTLLKEARLSTDGICGVFEEAGWYDLAQRIKTKGHL